VNSKEGNTNYVQEFGLCIYSVILALYLASCDCCTGYITPFRLAVLHAVHPHPLCTLCPHLLNVVYSLTRLLHSLTRSLYSVQLHPLAEQHRPLYVSITSSLCSLTRPLKKTVRSIFSFSCSLATVQLRLVKCPASTARCTASFVHCSDLPHTVLVPALTSQLTIYCICTMYIVQPLLPTVLPFLFAIQPSLLVFDPLLSAAQSYYCPPARFASSLSPPSIRSHRGT
jgi:hypothetical protein